MITREGRVALLHCIVLHSRIISYHASKSEAVGIARAEHHANTCSWIGVSRVCIMHVALLW